MAEILAFQKEGKWTQEHDLVTNNRLCHFDLVA